MTSRVFTTVAAAAVVAACAGPADALVRRAAAPLLWHRTAVSGFYGSGLPVGVFASSRLGPNGEQLDGNHEDGAEDWAVEIEHFVSPTVSIGFSIANTTYTDKTYPDLETDLDTYSGFLRAVVPTGSAVRPYVRAGVGSVQVEFRDPQSRVDAEYTWSFQFGGGLLWLPVRWLGLNAQALYYFDSTEDAYIAEVDRIVGFDCTYWAFAGGVSLFFP